MKIHGIDIAEALEKKIISSRMMPGIKLPSAVELAKQYSVSPKTADRALDRLAKRKLIIRKRGCGNFVLDHRSPESRIRVGVLYWTLNEHISQLDFDPSNIFFDMLKKLMDERRINYSTFVEDSSRLSQPANREKKYDIFLMPAGVILNDKEIYRSDIRMPLVIYGDCKYNSGPWHQIIYNFQPGFTEALKYCRRIKKNKFFLPLNDLEIVQEKYQVLMQCAENLGFKSSDFHLCHIPEHIQDTISGGEYCAEYFVKNHLQNHLIFSLSDFFTYGMQKVFKQKNLHYPADYSMISYDNYYKYLGEQCGFFNIPSITHPLEEHARAIVDMIEELDRHPDNGCFRAYITMAEEFVIR
ncbi:MAG: GntR family transcriptional regulator [Lentisphaerae bacterium]|nr:GntR family transcriptional regulator [Lentisphaerota bacterium]